MIKTAQEIGKAFERVTEVFEEWRMPEHEDKESYDMQQEAVDTLTDFVNEKLKE